MHMLLPLLLRCCEAVDQGGVHAGIIVEQFLVIVHRYSGCARVELHAPAAPQTATLLVDVGRDLKGETAVICE